MTYKCYDHVTLGENVTIEDYAIIGKPYNDSEPPPLTIIGDNAIIRSHTVIYAGTVIGNNFQCGHHVLIRNDCQIGVGVSIGSGSVLEHHIQLEEAVRIHSQAFICEYSIIKHHAWVGPNVVFTNSKYPQYEASKDHLEGVTVSPYAKVGANATLLPGVTIGEKALVGAGSVVTQDVASNTIVVGNPATYLKEADEVSY